MSKRISSRIYGWRSDWTTREWCIYYFGQISAIEHLRTFADGMVKERLKEIKRLEDAVKRKKKK